MQKIDHFVSGRCCVCGEEGVPLGKNRILWTDPIETAVAIGKITVETAVKLPRRNLQDCGSNLDFYPVPETHIADADGGLPSRCWTCWEKAVVTVGQGTFPDDFSHFRVIADEAARLYKEPK